MEAHVKIAIGLTALALSTTFVACSRTGLLVDDESPGDYRWPSTCSRTALPLSVAENPPNLYFVLDRSGSMSESMPGGTTPKYEAVQRAAVELVRGLGSHVSVGAAIFPAAGGVCDAGEEVFATARGDATPAAGAPDGPTTSGFDAATKVVTLGYTPTAATLQHLLPTLSALHGRTAVILATDGGPNCNAQAGCDASGCISNIQQVPGCTGSVNCCAASVGADAQRMCLDRDATLAAVRALSNAGIATYVIGIPGSDPFTELLGDLAKAGGTARATGPAYYAVGDLPQLHQALDQIGGDLMTCEFALDRAPADPPAVKVFLDDEEIGLGDTDGWTWTSSTTFRLVGPACDAYVKGRATRVEAFEWCDDGKPLTP